MKIWAHRGCSQMYPENTLLAFEKAAQIIGLTGIELDIQLTKDGHLAVCHDERVDRTTDGTGMLCDYTLSELKRLKIAAEKGQTERIPTMEEVLDLLEPRLWEGLQINIELKNSVVPYEGMEEKIISLIRERGLQKNIVYSSFNALSLEKVRRLEPEVRIGILDSKISDCLYKLKGGCGADDLHPSMYGIDIPPEKFQGFTVRAWGGGRLYPEKPSGNRLNLAALEQKGITDVFLNEPEVYCAGLSW